MNDDLFYYYKIQIIFLYKKNAGCVCVDKKSIKMREKKLEIFK